MAEENLNLDELFYQAHMKGQDRCKDAKTGLPSYPTARLDCADLIDQAKRWLNKKIEERRQYLMQVEPSDAVHLAAIEGAKSELDMLEEVMNL